jgi:uncharacterized protein YndB with AHSA1/START domain
MTTPTPIKTTELTVTRTIPATPAEVYDVWLDSAHPGGPWHGGGGARVIVDARVDGLFFIEARHEGRTWPHYGRFVTLQRPSRIAHTWMSEPTRGLESVVTVTLEARGEETLVTLHHAGLPDDEAGRGHADGWTWVLGCLADAMASRAKG